LAGMFADGGAATRRPSLEGTAETRKAPGEPGAFRCASKGVGADNGIRTRDLHLGKVAL
jgi:hypothetical protein